MNSLEYGEAPEYFLPSEAEQKIIERAETVARPGKKYLKFLQHYFLQL
jgi:hypothetical protein